MNWDPQKPRLTRNESKSRCLRSRPIRPKQTKDKGQVAADAGAGAGAADAAPAQQQDMEVGGAAAPPTIADVVSQLKALAG